MSHETDAQATIDLFQQRDAWPRISVITPSYNQGVFLERCIRSVLDQKYPNLEYIIIDGGSADDSVAIIQRYADRVDYWVSEPDAGQADAINKGFARATGEIVAWLNSDDYYLPGALAAVAEVYRRHPAASFYYGDGLRVDRHERTIAPFFSNGTPPFARSALAFGLNYILQPAAFIRRASLAQAGPLDPNLHYGLDTDLWLRLAALSAPAPIAARLAASREYGATKTATGAFRRVEELRQIAEKHSGAALTPGVICYFLDTLQRYAQEHPDLYPPEYQQRIMSFWADSTQLLSAFGARRDGIPRARSVSNLTVVGVELRHITLGESGGIAPLLAQLLDRVFALHPDMQFAVFCTVFNREFFERSYPHVRFYSLSTVSYYTDLDRVAEELGIDVLIRGYPDNDPLQFPLHRQIVMIPDLQHEFWPEFFAAEVLRNRRTAFNRMVGGAGAIATISEHARHTLRNHSWTRCEDIFLASPALPPDYETLIRTPLLASDEARLPQGEFLLYPANLWPHKNHRRVLLAFALFVRRTQRPIELVCTGHPDGWAELQAEFAGVPVRHLGFVSQRLLRALFERSRALVYFSLFEGFGIPLLEAFHAGTPVICSNTTSLPEVGGDAVLSCDPTDVEAMSRLMEQIVIDEALRRQLIDRGRERLAAFTWDQSARNLGDAIRRVNERAWEIEANYQLRPSTAITPGGAADASNWPLVTIVTPSYNQGRFLKRTIESVLNQTYPHIEYLVIDGGSTDESVDILRAYGDRFFWISEPDRGQTDAINKGLARAQGTILAYLNSDDVLQPDAIEKVVGYFRTHPGIDMIYGRAYYIDEDDRVTGMYATDEYSFTRLMEDNCVCQPAAFWRARIAEQVGPFDDQLHYVMDYDYWLRIDRAGGNIMHVPDILASSRLYAETKTLSARPKIFAEIFQICLRHGGYISRSYVYGYWHHLCFERTDGWPAFLARMPKFYGIMTRLSYRWYNRRRYTPRYIARLVWWRIRHRRIGRALHWLLARYWRRLSGATVEQRVRGFWSDNWLGAKCVIPLSPTRAVTTFHLAGTAARNTRLTIRADRRVIGQWRLRVDQWQSITFDLGLEPARQITLHFSHSLRASDGRQLAFRLAATDLFSERDIVG